MNSSLIEFGKFTGSVCCAYIVHFTKITLTSLGEGSFKIGNLNSLAPQLKLQPSKRWRLTVILNKGAKWFERGVREVTGKGWKRPHEGVSVFRKIIGLIRPWWNLVVAHMPDAMFSVVLQVKNLSSIIWLNFIMSSLYTNRMNNPHQ